MAQTILEKSRFLQRRNTKMGLIAQIIKYLIRVLLTLYIVVLFLDVKPLFQTLVTHCFYSFLAIYLLSLWISNRVKKQYFESNEELSLDFETEGNEEKYYSKVISKFGE